MNDDEQQLCDRIADLARQATNRHIALRDLLACLHHGDGAIYDPITDQYAMRVPGELVRNINGLIGPPTPRRGPGRQETPLH